MIFIEFFVLVIGNLMSFYVPRFCNSILQLEHFEPYDRSMLFIDFLKKEGYVFTIDILKFLPLKNVR